MRVLIVSFCLYVMVSSQTHSGSHYHKSSQDAAILSDDRYLAGDGTFGAAYSQEDGVEFKEESDANGDRRGSYSYVDPNGQRHTVTYTAGKNGFQATGDHIPTAPPPVAPQPEYVPLPQYNPPDYQPPASYQHAQQQYRPLAEYQYETAEPQSVYEYRPQYRYRPEPRPPQPLADPIYNSIPSYRQEPRALQPRPQPLAQTIPETEYNSIGSFAPRTVYQYQYRSPAKPEYNEITTPTPRRIYPPGKLNFNRTPDGFSYSFAKAK